MIEISSARALAAVLFVVLVGATIEARAEPGGRAAIEARAEPEARAAIDASAEPGAHTAPSPSPTPTSRLTLAEVIDRALERDLGSAVPEALRAEAAALRQMSSRWFPGGATIQASVVDNGTFSANGYRQWNTGLQVPLWWPGQRSRWKELAESTGATARETEHLRRLEVAGWIRTVLMRVELAEVDVALWRDEVDSQSELVRSIGLAVELGEIAGRDLLRAETARLEAAERYSVAREALHESSALYRALTGLDERPVHWIEPVSPSDDIESHPALLVAREAVRLAEGRRRVARSDGWPAAAASIGTQHERSGGAGRFNDRIVAGLVIPLGRRRNASVEVAQAAVEIARARRDEVRLERRLRLEIDRARHEYELSAERAENASARSKSAAALLETTRRAFELGEADVSDLVRARTLAVTAARDRAAAAIRLEAGAGAINQALGIVP